MIMIHEYDRENHRPETERQPGRVVVGSRSPNNYNSSSSLIWKMCSLKLKILEQCQISSAVSDAKLLVCNGSSSSGIISSSSNLNLGLTFLDIPWLLFPPSQTLFFFNFQSHHDSNELFRTTIVPTLKHSLFSTLQHFFPFAATLKFANMDTDTDTDTDININNHHHPAYLHCSSSATIPFTVAEAEQYYSDFHHLCAHHQRNAAQFHQLVPHLNHHHPPSSPLLAIQITHFPKEATLSFSIGISYHHLVCDQRSFNNFIRSWACFSNMGQIPPHLQPTFDRSLINDPTPLRPLLFNQFCLSSKKEKQPYAPQTDTDTDMVRATFVLGPTHINNIRQWIQAKCHQNHKPHPTLLSPYVITSAFLWPCFLMAQYNKSKGKGSMYLGFIAGGITRLPFSVPVNYFGNCVGFGRAVAKREDLLKQDGVLTAAYVIAKAIKDLDADILGGARKWIPDWEVLIGSDLHINLVGSPKVDLYETDFGWGIPKKIEEISIDAMRGISLIESRDMKGGIEIGLTQPKFVMDTFSSLFKQGLSSLGIQSHV